MLNEKFRLFIKSSFGRETQTELFEYIWKNYRKKISFYISNLVSCQETHFEDIFQEVMLKIYNNLHTFNPAHSFKAWIYQISRNHCLDYLKCHARRSVNAGELDDKDIPDPDTVEHVAMKTEIQEKTGTGLFFRRKKLPVPAFSALTY